MDLGITYSGDTSSSAGILSPEEIAALLGPLDMDIPTKPSAIQVLLNQGAEALAQKPAAPLDNLCPHWLASLKRHNHKITGLIRLQSAGALGAHPLICPFKTTAGTGFCAFDWTTAYLLIDGMLGGINGLSIEKKADGTYSAIEQNLLEPVFHHLIHLLADTLAMTPTFLPLLTTLPAQTPETHRTVFTLHTPISAGKIMLEMPQALVPEPTPEFLFTSPEKILSCLSFETAARLSAPPITVQDIQKWAVGTTLPLKNTVRLMCGKKSLAQGTVHTQGPQRLFSVQENA